LLVNEACCGISRDVFMQRLHERDIGTGVHYLSIAEHPYYQQRFGWRLEQWPNALRVGRETVSLPLSAKLSEHDLARLILAVRTVF
jgi:dTDP-4-amino-4,6-dideoxygalactose transaminase